MDSKKPLHALSKKLRSKKPQAEAPKAALPEAPPQPEAAPPHAPVESVKPVTPQKEEKKNDDGKPCLWDPGTWR